MINKEEFFKRLKEDVFFSNIDEHSKYRFPVVKFFIANYTGIEMSMNGKVFDLKKIELLETSGDSNFRLLNYAFNRIKERFDRGELK